MRYFHCPGECALTVPLGEAYVTAWRGLEHTPVRQQGRCSRADAANRAVLALQPLQLPDWAPRNVSADLHVHMNYGGHYRNTEENLIEQARAEDLDVVYNLIVNKEQRIPDIARFDPARDAATASGVTIFRNQEYHTSYWGHLGLLHLQRYLTPDFSAYQYSALTSPYPNNGVIADLAHEQGGLVGYVHPFDTVSRSRARVADERDARRRRARQSRLHRGRRLRRPQVDGGGLVQAAEPGLPRAHRLRHRCDGELREPARTGRHESRLSRDGRQRRARGTESLR